MQPQRFHDFADFYLFYLEEHRSRISRRLHVCGTFLALCLLAAGVAVNAWLLLAAPVAGYGFAWIGHYFFEHNRPATFRHPVWSLRGDLRLFCEVITGARRF